MLFGCIWTRKSFLSESTIRHENIHALQEKELWYIGFWFWYVFEFCIRLLQFRFNGRLAYRNISFEREAYENEHDKSYIENRKPFSFEAYL
jgi:hypothetical protein